MLLCKDWPTERRVPRLPLPRFLEPLEAVDGCVHVPVPRHPKAVGVQNHDS